MDQGERRVGTSHFLVFDTIVPQCNGEEWEGLLTSGKIGDGTVTVSAALAGLSYCSTSV